jgi:hypothetical protein
MEFMIYEHCIPKEYLKSGEDINVYLFPFRQEEYQPSEDINVYSFALRPEEHQPSGTCNFSRINSYNKVIFDLLDAYNILFIYDYEKIKESSHNINKEIIERYYKPDNIDKWIHEINE